MFINEKGEKKSINFRLSQKLIKEVFPMKTGKSRKLQEIILFYIENKKTPID